MIIEIGKKKILFANRVIRTIKKYAKQCELVESFKESGGIILAQYNGELFYIKKISSPSSFDIAERFSFLRNKFFANSILNKEFKKSKSKTIYIGEWHTHPEDKPTPSKQDIEMIKKQFQKNKLNEKYLILMIVGKLNIYLGLYDGNEIESGVIPLSCLS